MAKTTIYAAKININENIFSPNYENIIPLIGEAVLNKNVIESREYNKSHRKNIKYTECVERFHFSKTEKVDINGYEYIFGYLHMSRDSYRVIENGDEDDVSTKKENNIISKNMFLLDVDNEIIVFESNKNLNYSKFMKYFAQLCSSINYNIGKLVLTLYPKNYEIDRIVCNMDKIYSAEFKIIPANFKSNRGFMELDKVMKNEGIEELTQIIKNKNGNIDSSEGSIFSNAMDMVKKAYGNCIVKYRDKSTGEDLLFKSKDKIYVEHIDKDINDESDIKTKFSEFIEKIKSENNK